MLLKKEERNDYLVRILQFLGRCLWNKKIIGVYLLAVFLIGLLFGLGISGFFGPIDNPSPILLDRINKLLSTLGSSDIEAYNIVLGIRYENIKIPLNYLKGTLSSPEHIDIDIKFNDFLKIAYQREISIAENQLFTIDEEYVPAQIRHRDQTIDVKIRLKGEMDDHWVGDKWSFRIKTKGDSAFLGMKEFSIQDPRTRNYINEWIFHKAIEREGIIALRYYFVDVTINGKHKGIYALEEHFDKLLIEHNNSREGPIIRYEGNIVDTFQTDQIIQNPVQYQAFLKAKDLVELFRNGILKTSEVFDIDKLASFMAICDVLSATHAMNAYNLNFYYNPITSKIEPIGYDATAVQNHNRILCEPEHPGYWVFEETAFKDMVFFERYLQKLESFSQASYLNGLLDEFSVELKTNLDIVHKDSPFFHFNKQLYVNNQNYIKTILNQEFVLPAYFDHYSDDGTIALEIGSVFKLPVEILGLSYQESQVFEPSEPRTILHGRIYPEPIPYEMIEFQLPKDIHWSDEHIPDLKINYRILGTSQLRSEKVMSWSRISKNFADTDLIRQEPNVEKFDFVVIDSVARNIFVKQGNWELSENLIIPAGYTVSCGEGTRIELKNNANILSYSPFQFLGSEDNPILVTSSDSTGQGIIVLNAGSQSTLENVIFQNLSAPSQGGWELTGAITFYESPVKFSGCQFLDNRAGDDMLNVVRSAFEISNCLFRHTFSDAIDVDFGNGVISHSSFTDIGGDGADISGGTADIVNCIISKAGDKGVSAGENSQVEIKEIKLKECYIAIASKDISQVNIQSAKISDCEVGLTVYQKKSEFGPSMMTASLVEIINTAKPYLVEEGSNLLVNSQKIGNYQKNVYQMLYSEE